MNPLSLLLGLAWGAVLVAPVLAHLRRDVSRQRTRTLRSVEMGPEQVRPRQMGVVGRVISGVRTQLRARRMTIQIRRDLPVTIDVLGVAVGAGLTPYLSVEVASLWIPVSVSTHFAGIVHSVGIGMRFSEALDQMALGAPVFRPVADALLSSERLGAPVAPALDRLATEARADARREAETRARKVPVRLLFPLVFLVLPAFVLLTVVPALVAGTG